MDEQSAWKARVAAMGVRRKLRAEYQAAIDTFEAELDRIDLLNDTYAKICYVDAEVRTLPLHGIPSPPKRYDREIRLDEIILNCPVAED
jgi:hypothetical protein